MEPVSRRSIDIAVRINVMMAASAPEAGPFNPPYIAIGYVTDLTFDLLTCLIW